MGEISGRPTNSQDQTMRAIFLATIAITLVLGFATAASDAGSKDEQKTCSDTCFGENCDFWVKQWGLSCDVVEAEYGCSCGGCACAAPNKFEDDERSYGTRRTGTGTAPTAAPTAMPTIAGELKITTTVVFAGVSASQFGDTEKTAACQAITANPIGSLTLSASDCVVTSVTSSSRRSGSAQVAFDLYTGTTDASVVASASTALNTYLTDSGSTGFATTFNTKASNLGSSVSTSGITVTQAPAAVSTTPTAAPTAPTAAPTATQVDSAPASAGLSMAAILGVAYVLKHQLL